MEAQAARGPGPFPDVPPSAAERLLAGRRGRVTVALAVGAVFVRVLLCLQLGGGPLPRIQEFWPESDNSFFDAWGRRIAGGDLLQREPWHPMARWMESVAKVADGMEPAIAKRLGVDRLPDAPRRAALWDHWMGGATWYQEPGYAWLVGLTYRVAGPHGWNVFAWQLLLGVASVLLVHRLALRLFRSETAAAVAGALAVLAPVPLFYEVTLLRDGLVAALTLALAWVMAWATEGPRRRWLLLGVAFGAAALVKQTFLVFPVAMGAWRLATVRAPARDRLAAAGLAAAGILAALLPAILRNLAVGVAPLAMNGSAAAMLPLNHTSVAEVFGIRVDTGYVRALIASDGSPLRALRAAADTHPGPWSLLRLELQKVLYTWHGYEAPNNVDFYLFRQAAPVLAWLPARFVVLVPLAAVGVAREGRRAWPLLIAVAASLPSMVIASVLARYRAAMVLPMLPLAAAGLVQLGTWIAARRWRPLAAVALLSAGYLAWATGEPPGKGDAARAAEYAGAGRAFAAQQPEYAALNLREALRLAPDDAGARALLDQLERARSRREAALRGILEERP